MRCFFCYISLLFSLQLLAQTAAIDFKRIHAQISIDPHDQIVQGQVDYDFIALKPVDSIVIDAKAMEFEKVMLNGDAFDFTTTDSHLILYGSISSESQYVLSLEYTAKPKKAMYFIDWNIQGGRKQVWTQGQGKDNSHWLPSFDNVNEKVEFDLSITFDKDYEVISNGKLIRVEEKDGLRTWHYDMQQPMSSYLAAIAIGKYDRQVTHSESGVPIELYYYPEDSLKVEPTYRYTKQIFDFLEEEIGVPYPWQNYKQVPVKDFLYAGMENTTATIFSDSFVIDSTAFVDRNYVNVNAHELAHQWFGNLVTAKSGKHHWLHEGFATYYAYLAEGDIFGDSYFKEKLLSNASILNDLSDEGKGEVLLAEGGSSLTYYEKGALALYELKNLVGGQVFQGSVKKYLSQFQFESVQTHDFFHFIESATDQDMEAYKQKWLYSADLPETAIVVGEDHTEEYEKHLAPTEYAIVKTIDSITALGKPLFEKSLKSKSYKNIENALLKLWLQFPEDRYKYLDATKEVVGFNNKNVRQLWLALALVTPEYEVEHKQDYFQELSGYTRRKYNYETRRLAFDYLFQLSSFTDQNLKDLVNACVHHNWRFVSSSRKLLDVLLEEESYEKRLGIIADQLEEREQIFLKDKLNE